MPFNTTVNWLFNDMWRYLVIAYFDLKIGLLQQIVVRVYYILKRIHISAETLEKPDKRKSLITAKWKRFQ